MPSHKEKKNTGFALETNSDDLIILGHPQGNLAASSDSACSRFSTRQALGQHAAWPPLSAPGFHARLPIRAAAEGRPYAAMHFKVPFVPPRPLGCIQPEQTGPARQPLLRNPLQ